MGVGGSAADRRRAVLPGPGAASRRGRGRRRLVGAAAAAAAEEEEAEAEAEPEAEAEAQAEAEAEGRASPVRPVVVEGVVGAARVGWARPHVDAFRLPLRVPGHGSRGRHRVTMSGRGLGRLLRATDGTFGAVLGPVGLRSEAV